MAKIKVKKVRSAINRTKRQKLTLLALGLKKIGQVVEHDATPKIKESVLDVVKVLVKAVLPLEDIKVQSRVLVILRN